MPLRFQSWSAKWKDLKARTGGPNDITDVLHTWEIPPPSQTFGRVFPAKVGSRKNYLAPVGEQLIELQLLGSPGSEPRFHTIYGSSVSDLAVCGIFNNFAA